METAINAIIVDDASQARNLLRLMLAEYAPDVAILGEAANATEAIALVKSVAVDVIFLDIEMPGKSGLQVVGELHQACLPCDVIFTTAYNKYAIQAFRLSAVDYLLKPIDEKQLQEAVEKIREKKASQQNQQRLEQLIDNLQKETPTTLSLPIANGYEYVAIADIVCIKADGSYAQVFVLGKSPITISKNLKYFEQVLEGFGEFVRVHRSFLINMQQVKRFERSGRGTIIMADGQEVDLARERRDTFFKALEHFAK